MGDGSDDDDFDCSKEEDRWRILYDRTIQSGERICFLREDVQRSGAGKRIMVDDGDMEPGTGAANRAREGSGERTSRNRSKRSEKGAGAGDP